MQHRKIRLRYLEKGDYDMHLIYIVGMGPGKEEGMTAEAEAALSKADVIVGYPVYLELLGSSYSQKKMLATPMRQEKERCIMAFEEAQKGSTIALICSGDAGVYGMAGLMYELLPSYPDCCLQVIPGVTAALSGSAVLGAPLGNDFCVISLSDQLTPWEKIEQRLRAAAAGDFNIALYNPRSHSRRGHLQKACDILLDTLPSERICGYVRNIGRTGEVSGTMTLGELRTFEADMFTTVFIGSSQTTQIGEYMVTRRGYRGINEDGNR